MNRKIFTLFITIAFLVCSGTGAQKIFPGAHGMGTHSRGAYAGDTLPRVLFVDNLDDSGPGSLRDAVSRPFPRVVVFNISGAIRLNKALIVNHPYLFIAGQSAPGKGITIEGAPVIIRSHDILVQDTRFRLGADYPRQADCVSITGTGRNVTNVVFDRCSFAFGLDETIGILDAGPGITISNSIIGYGLNKLGHSCGLLALNSEGISLIGNILAFNHDRNPNIRGDTGQVEVLNNLIYNSGSHAVYLGSRGPRNRSLEVLLEKNLYITGPDNLNRFLLSVHEKVPDSLAVFWDGNLTLHEGKVFDDVENQLFDNSRRFVPVTDRPFPASVKSLDPASDLFEKLTERAGARPGNRDSLDSLIVENIKNQEGHIVSDEKELGISIGFPSEMVQNQNLLPENMHQLEGDSGFTILEWYLFGLLK